MDEKDGVRQHLVNLLRRAIEQAQTLELGMVLREQRMAARQNTIVDPVLKAKRRQAGLKGGAARAAKLTAARRREIALMGVAAARLKVNGVSTKRGIGGYNRMKRMSPEARTMMAKKAIEVRWEKWRRARAAEAGVETRWCEICGEVAQEGMPRRCTEHPYLTEKRRRVKKT